MSKEIRFLEAQEIETSSWDQLIFDAPNGMIYCYSWYLDMIAPSWGAMVLGNYQAVLPLVYNKKCGIEYIYPPKWAQQMGVISREKTSTQLVESLLRNIPPRFRYISTLLNSSNPPIGYGTIIKHRNCELPLNKDYKELRSNYSSQIKRNIKNAEKNHLQYFENDRPEVLIDLFRNNKGKELRLKEADYTSLKHLMYACIHKGVGKVCSVYGDRNDLQAAAFFLSYFERSIFLFSGLNKYGRETGAMSLLIDRYIAPFSGRGHILDFEGSDNDNLARFYLGFGSEEFTYQQIIMNKLPWPLRYFKR